MDIFSTHKDLLTVVIGDIHEDFNLLRDKIKYYNFEDAVIFIAGDFGVGFNYNDPREPAKEKKRLQDLNAFFKKRKIFVYVVRGNHDNPVFFDGNHNLTNLVFMKDYDVVTVGEKNYLCIGGATSVDRKPNDNFKDYRGKQYPGRKEGKDWWPEEEKVVYNEEKLETLIGINVVVTHTCPNFVHPNVIGGTVLKWIEYDKELKQELIDERELVAKIYNKITELNTIKFWFYGHFHHTNTVQYENTKFCLLDVGEVREVRYQRNLEF